ncbi:hemin uptake protein HemP [Devosia sp.]|uniref:hemin uptake protein HemP n=1 Tax=Devosia sp. TaxID=1871048 RepID=UPI003F71C4B4
MTGDIVALACRRNSDNHTHVLNGLRAAGVTKVRLEDLQDMTALPETAARPDQQVGLPSFTTEELFGGANEIGIAHQGLTYRLRITRQGKLVLNK